MKCRFGERVPALLQTDREMTCERPYLKVERTHRVQFLLLLPLGSSSQLFMWANLDRLISSLIQYTTMQGRHIRTSESISVPAWRQLTAPE